VSCQPPEDTAQFPQPRASPTQLLQSQQICSARENSGGRIKSQGTSVSLFSCRHPRWPWVRHLQAQCVFTHFNHMKEDFKSLHLHLNSSTNLAFDLSSYIRITKSAQGSTSARNNLVYS